ncbi:MAG TPA: hypothetical protein PLD54_02645 [Candidatus Levybacteria bacterium]|nr:hypothetical protein [Candidatus Levybacteria bacterium]
MKKEFLGISSTEWRIIGISLSVLSLGLAIAWAGLVIFRSS